MFVPKLELSEGPDDPSKAHSLEQEMGFSCRQANGELTFAMMVGRVDTSYPIIKLSRCSAHPSSQQGPLSGSRTTIHLVDVLTACRSTTSRSDRRTHAMLAAHLALTHDLCRSWF
jgi:hypothetical protein